MKFIYLIFLLGFAIGCQPNGEANILNTPFVDSEGITLTKTPRVAATATISDPTPVTVSPTPTLINPTHTKIPNNETPTPELVITPTLDVVEIVPVEKVGADFEVINGAFCDTQQFVNFTELELGFNGILGRQFDEFDSGLWIFLEDQETPHQIPNTQTVGNGPSKTFGSINLSGRILYYEQPEQEYETVDDIVADFFTINVDGEKEFLINTNRNKSLRSYWVDVNTIFFSSGIRTLHPYNGRISHDYFSASLFSLRDQNQTSLALPPENALALNTSVIPISNELIGFIYLLNEQFLYFDYLTGSSTLIFPWLNSELLSQPPEIVSQLIKYRLNENQRFNLLIKDRNYFEYVIDVQFEDLLNPGFNVELAKRELVLPAPYSQLEPKPLGWIANKNQFLFSYSSLNRGVEFLLVDFEKSKVINYCVGTAFTFMPTVSPDSQFVAWLDQYNLSSDRGIVVLELSSGEVVRLGGWHFEGWILQE
ncbi:MAG: hypothetical protein AAF490_31515 [Chloroflexota bacterium]